MIGSARDCRLSLTLTPQRSEDAMKLTKSLITPEIEQRFWSKVDRQEGPVRRGELSPCWPYLEGKYNAGYGQFAIDHSTSVGAHRVAFVLSDGVLTGDKPDTLHRCDFRPCCNPDHLFAGDQADNNADMMAKGRHSHGDAHYSRTRPQCLARGDRNGARIHPETRRGERNGRAILTEADAIEILLSPLTARVMAAEKGVSRQTIQSIRQRLIWRHVSDPRIGNVS